MKKIQKELNLQPVRHGGRCRLQEGFTLMELLVAITIFAISFLGLAAGATSVMRANQISYFHTIAVNLAQDQIEQLRAMTAMPNCPAYTSAGCFDNSSVPGSGVVFNRSWRITASPAAAALSQIDVQVTWTDYTNQSVVISSAVK